jgi:hypothetical protein
MPLVPVQYEEAIKNLRACQTIGDAKYWASAADALAAWAKMAHDETVLDEARKLKAEARRQMGLLAEQLRPPKRDRAKCSVGGCDSSTKSPGVNFCRAHYLQRWRAGDLPKVEKAGSPASLLREHGLTAFEATNSMRLARMPEEKFRNAVESGATPRSIAFLGRGLGRQGRAVSSEGWTWLALIGSGARLPAVRSLLKSRSARSVAAGLTKDEADKARKLVVEIVEWLDEFEQYLPK